MSSAAGAPTAPNLDGVRVTLGGTARPIRSVLVYSRGGAALQVSMSSYPMACTDLVGRGTVLEPDELVIDVTIAPRLTPAGEEAWRVTRVRLGKTTRQGDLGSATVVAYDPRQDVRASFQAAVLLGADRLDIDARIDVAGCGVLPFNDRTEVRPQGRLEIELAGKRVEMHGASLVAAADGARTVRLSSEPHACITGTLGSDYSVSLTLASDGEHAGHVRLEGYSLVSQLGADLDPGAIAVRMQPLGDDAVAVEAELIGEARVGSYRMKLSGTASLERCGVSAKP